MNRLILLLCLFMSCTQLSAQSKTAEEFDKIATGYKLFAYQSMLRTMNTEKVPEFNMLIRDLDHLRIVTSGESGAEALKIFEKLDRGVRAEGFEEVMVVDDKDYELNFYEKTGGSSMWILTFRGLDTSGLIEMKGHLDMKYIGALKKLRTETIEELWESAKKFDN